MIEQLKESSVYDDIVSIHHTAWWIKRDYCQDEAHTLFAGVDDLLYKYQCMIERIENIPCNMACYLTKEEQASAQKMKKTIMEILKGE